MERTEFVDGTISAHTEMANFAMKEVKEKQK
jgi:hypothetical protein